MSGFSNGTLFEQGSSSGSYVPSPSNEERIQDAQDSSYVQSPSIDEHTQDVQASSLVTSELLPGSSDYGPPIEINTKLSEETHENYLKCNKDDQADSSSEAVKDLHTSVMVDTDRSGVGGGQDPEPQENVNSHYDERLSERRSQIISNETKKDLPDNKVNESDDNNVKVNTFDDCENAKKPTEVHLSIRLPDGTSLQEKFSVTSTLRSVSDYVNENQASEIGLYDLAIPYPRKVFKEEDFSKALSELGMFNRQALIVVPRHQRSLKVQSLSSRNTNLTSDAGPSNSSNGGYFDYVKRALSYMNPFSYLGSSASSSSSEQSNERFWQYRPNPTLLNQPTEADKQYSSYSPSSSNPMSGSPSKNKKPTSHFGSNIHTLRHDEDDDRFSGRNAFWNGNSTQYGGDDSK